MEQEKKSGPWICPWRNRLALKYPQQNTPTHTHTQAHIHTHTLLHTHTRARRNSMSGTGMYGVALVSRLLKIIGLFCKRALQKRPIFSEETYNFKEPTNRSHPIPIYAHSGIIELIRGCIVTLCGITHSHERNHRTSRVWVRRTQGQHKAFVDK